MGIVSKSFLEEINNKLNKNLCYNQWLSTSTLINGSGLLKLKKTVNSLNLTLQNSTSAELLEKSINFARRIIKIEGKIINIIKHARKSLLFHNGNALTD